MERKKTNEPIVIDIANLRELLKKNKKKRMFLEYAERFCLYRREFIKNKKLDEKRLGEIIDKLNQSEKNKKAKLPKVFEDVKKIILEVKYEEGNNHEKNFEKILEEVRLAK